MPRYDYVPTSERVTSLVEVERARQAAEESRRLANQSRAAETAATVRSNRARGKRAGTRTRTTTDRPKVERGFEEVRLAQRIMDVNGVTNRRTPQVSSDVPRVASDRRSGRANWRASGANSPRDISRPTEAEAIRNLTAPSKVTASPDIDPRFDHGHVRTRVWTP